MKIVTWNCNGALRKKFEQLQELEADVYIIQECEDPKKQGQGGYREWAENHLWVGDTKNKGLGIFASKSIGIRPLNWTNSYNDHNVKHFLPCSVNGAFDLLAVWTHQNNSPNFGYIGQFWKYLQVNKAKLNKSIIAGDFNSNVVWDQWDIWWNHSDVVKELHDIGIESIYHRVTGEDQGKETLPTFFLNRKLERPYHIDYLFAAQEFASRIKTFEIGSYDLWIKISDHLPLICEFEEEI